MGKFAFGFSCFTIGVCSLAAIADFMSGKYIWGISMILLIIANFIMAMINKEKL